MPPRLPIHEKSGSSCIPDPRATPRHSAMSLAMISSCSMSFAAPVASSMTGLARSSTLVMGFGPSEKDLSNDPPIKEVLAIAKVEQQARLARLAMATVGGATFAKTLPVRTLINAWPARARDLAWRSD